MSDDEGRPPRKTPDKDRFETSGAGRVGRDDRGNMTWEWADDGELLADDTFGASQRLRALVDPALAIEEADLAASGPVASNPKGLIKGYDPYQSGALGKNEWRRKRNLRELSKWIELKKKVEESGGDGRPDDSDQE